MSRRLQKRYGRAASGLNRQMTKAGAAMDKARREGRWVDYQRHYKKFHTLMSRAVRTGALTSDFQKG